MTAAARQVFFVDSRVADYQTLIAGLAEGSEWHLLQAGEDGIRQMERILSAHSGLDAIQILSHGAPGTLYLGDTVLTSGNLTSYEAALRAIGASLSETGDILVYGCSVARGGAGVQFINDVAGFTGADVAASDNLTGSTELDGDWVLEKSTGQIDVTIALSEPAQTAYSYSPLLAFSLTQSRGLYPELAMLAVKAYENPGLSVNWGEVDSSYRDMALEAAYGGIDGRWAAITQIGNLALSDGVFIHDGAAAYLAESIVDGKRTMVIAFRGTDCWSDAWNYGGFTLFHYNKFAALLSELDAYVADPANAIEQVFVTGHSLGGAMAQIFLDDVVEGRFPNISIQECFGATFGSPGAHTLGDIPHLSHFYNLYDPVPRAGNLIGYHDTGDSSVMLDVPAWLLTNHAKFIYAEEIWRLASQPDQDVISSSATSFWTQDGATIVLGYASAQNNDLSVINLIPASHIWNPIYVLGGSQGDEVASTGGDDWLWGLDGDDLLDGGGGVDRMYGGRGNDTYVVNVGGPSGDAVIENSNEGTDTVLFGTQLPAIPTPGATYDLPDNVENLILLQNGYLSGADVALHGRGNALDNELTGNDADNQLFGGAGNDTLIGGMGDNLLDGGSGFDMADYSQIGHPIILVLGEAGAGHAYSIGVAYYDTLVDVEGAFGTSFNDSFTGNSYDNFFELVGGSDVVDGGGGNDWVSYGRWGYGLTVDLSVEWQDVNGRLISIENVWGSTYGDWLYGNIHANFLRGGSGVDRLQGCGGEDNLAGGSSADTFIFDGLAIPDARAGIFDTISDYNQGNATNHIYFAGEGDIIDLTVAIASLYPTPPASLKDLVRAEKDASGTFANLYIKDPNGTSDPGDDTWLKIAKLDGIQGGNTLKLKLDAGNSNSTANITVAGAADARTGQVTTFQPNDGKDTYIRSSVSTSGDMGQDNGYLMVGGWSDEYYTFIQFDLSGLPRDANSVILSLHEVYGEHGPWTYPEMSLWTVDGQWAEGMQWNQNTTTATFVKNIGRPDGIGWFEIDITDIYQRWQSGALANSGIQLRPLSTTANQAYFVSSESADVAHRPTLVISSSGWSITPATTSVSESGTDITLTVTRTSATTAQTVYLSTTINHGSLNQGDYDYWYSQPVDFNAGQASYTATIHINDDSEAEGSETFGFIVQDDPSKPVSDTLARAEFTITDDDVYVDPGAGESWTGTSASETRPGTSGHDTYRGYGGNDELYGHGGNDRLEGGSDDDRLEGGSGNDTLDSGDGGNDTLKGGSGDDCLSVYGSGADLIDGGAGFDTLSLARYDLTSAVTLTIAADSSGTIPGFSLPDGTTVSRMESLRLATGSGDDRVSFANTTTPGTQFWDGSLGNDTAVLDFSAFASALSSSTPPGANSYEYYVYVSGEGSPRLYLYNVENFHIRAGAGNDSLFGKSGNDTIEGGSGDDFIRSGAGVDVIDGGSGLDTLELDRSALTQSVTLAITSDGLGSTHDFSLADGTTVSGIETLNLLTGSGDDHVTFANTTSKMGPHVSGQSWDAGAGNDTAVLDFSAFGRAISAITGQYSYNNDVYYVQVAGTNTYDLVTIGVENVWIYGGAGDDSLSRVSGANALFGHDGNDTLTSGGGNDTLNGGTGNDSISVSGGGADLIEGGSGFDTLSLNRSDLAAAVTLAITVDASDTIQDFSLPDGTTVSGIEQLSLTTGSGDDRVSFVNTSTSASRYWYAGSGNDTAVLDFSGLGSGVSASHSYWNFDYYYAYVAGETRVSLVEVNNFSIYGGLGNDYLGVTLGTNVLHGNGGDDTLSGGSGKDTLNGGSGNDSISVSGGGADVIDGGSGFDTLSLTRSDLAVAVTLAITVDASDTIQDFSLPDGTTVSGIEFLNLTTGSGDDHVSFVNTSTSASRYWYAGSGNDTAVLDFSTLGSGVSASHSYWNFDYYYAYVAGETRVSLVEVNNFSIYGGFGNDYLGVTLGTNVLHGNGGDDTLSGGSGKDTLNGGSGNDSISVSGGGADVIDGGSGFDTLSLTRSDLAVAVTLAITVDASDTIQDFSLPDGTTVSGIEFLNLTTGSGDDHVSFVNTSTSASRYWYAGSGNDTAVLDFSTLGSGVSASHSYGNFDYYDAYVAGETRVSLVEVNNFSIYGGFGNDYLGVTLGTNVLHGNGGDDTLSGGSGKDTLNGGSGNDSISVSGGGADVIDGGSGFDTLSLTRSDLAVAVTLAITVDASDTIQDFSLPDGTTVSGIEFLNLTTGSGDDHVSFVNTSTSASRYWYAGSGNDTAVLDFSTLGSGVSASHSYGDFDYYDAYVAGETRVSLVEVNNFSIYGGFGNDNLSVTLGTNVLRGNGGDDSLTGGTGSDTVSGGAGKDYILGRDNDDSLDGGSGNDTLDGGGGDDSLNGGDGDDTLLFDASDSSVDGGAGTDVGVLSGASTAQARAFAMAAHSLEKLQWTVAGNTWSLALNGDGSRTETVSDTAASESSFASRTTRLAVSGAVDWIDTLADNGVRTYNDLDDLGNQAWTQLFQVYDGSGLVDFRDYRNDDGTRLVIDDDNLGNQGWTQIQQKYDTQGREDYRDYRLDDGRRQVVDYDQANDQSFVQLDQIYDAQGREDYRDYRLDDGRRQLVDYDQAGNQSWSQVIQLYDTQAREDYRDYRLDDGRRQLVDYDQANNQAWSRSTQLYDTLGRQDYRDYAMDDGSRTFIDYDQAGQFAWSEWQKEFDAAGTLLHQRISYDSGDIVYQ